MGVVDFVYHNTNACFKRYTHHKSAEAARKRTASQPSRSELGSIYSIIDTQEMEPTSKLLRSSSTPRAHVNSHQDLKNLKCIVCSSEALRVKGKRNRISYVTYLRAKLLLDSACFLKDEVYDSRSVRTEGYSSCWHILPYWLPLTNYLRLYERDPQNKYINLRLNLSPTTAKVNARYFMRVMRPILPLDMLLEENANNLLIQ